MNTPDISKRIQNIEERFATINGENKITVITNNLSSSSPKAYIGICIVVFLILAITRPSVLYEEETLQEPKFSFQKFLLYFITISFILVSSLFAYNYKKSS